MANQDESEPDGRNERRSDSNAIANGIKGSTVAVEDSDVILEDSSEKEEEPDGCWGKLIPLSASFRKVYLTNAITTFGRDVDSDYCLGTIQTSPGKSQSPSRSKANKIVALYSDRHFRIIKEDGKGSAVMIVDESRNGTFLNRIKIGKGKQIPLPCGVEISLASPSNLAFVFLDKEVIDLGFELPKEFESRFWLSKKLGQGACGTVFLCFSRGDDRRYAVKIMEKCVAGETPGVDKWNSREIDILQLVDHPNIIKVHEFYETVERVFIVLEFVDGGELFDWVIQNHAKLSLEERMGRAKWIFTQMALAIKHLHDQGITHRDLKPENVLLTGEDDDFVVKITDFGLSKIFDGSILKTFCGTPAYLAPEVICSLTGGESYTKAVDCWSMGVIVFILLVGYAPFSDEYTDMSLIEQIKTGRANFNEKVWKNVDPLGREIVEQLLQVDPVDRLTVDQILEHPWLADDRALKSRLRKKLPELKWSSPSAISYPDCSPFKRTLNEESLSEPQSPCKKFRED